MTVAALEHVRIVLVEPQHPGNIGAAARAMKTMGLERLVLVAPQRFPHADATTRASGAAQLLSEAVVVDRLDEAIRDCGLVIGTSARARSLAWPLVDARAAATQAFASSAPVAMVFGRERSGLRNDELDRCHLHLSIPVNPDFPSLNLAAAVQVVCYEMRMAAGWAPPPQSHEPAASAAELEGMIDHLRELAQASGFLDPARPRRLMRRFRRLFGRCQLEAAEVRMLRGLFTALDPRRR
ncbi:MAG: RNA methyltransferase [Salinisphaera sp.]|nr:RNA methyltransferase [Salinisphaera sp.]